MIWTLLTALYGVGVTIALAVVFWGHSGVEKELRAIGEATWATLPGPDRLKALGELSRLRVQERAWLERAVSTAGVVAFFSMLIGTGVQTVRVAVQEDKVERLESELKGFEMTRQDLDGTLADLATALTEEFEERGMLDEVQQRVLRRRFDRLAVSNAAAETLAERYTLAWILGEYDTAVDIVEKNPGVFEKSRPSDRLNLAEHYAITGIQLASWKIVEDLQKGAPTLTRTDRIRLLRVAAYLKGIDETKVLELARLLGQPQSEARRLLQRHVARMRQTAQR